MRRASFLVAGVLSLACTHGAAAPEPQRPVIVPAPPARASPSASAPRRAPAPEAPRASCREQPAAPRPQPPNSVRDVDWCNHDLGMVSLRDGSYELHEYADLGGEHDTDIFRLADVQYGDLDADDTEEAVLLVHHDFYGAGGGSATMADVHVYAFRDHAPVSMGQAPASRVPSWTFAFGRGQLTMSYKRNAASCVDRWQLRAAKLVFVDTLCQP